MSLSIMIHQMVLIFLLVSLGAICYKIGAINNEDQSRYLSSLILNVFNPVLIFSSVLSNSENGDRGQVWLVFGIAFVYYCFCVVFSNISALFLSKEKRKRQIYCLSMIFSNLGFIGIPIVNAMFGSSALIYVAIFILNYNIFFYAYCTLVFNEEGEKITLEQIKGIVNPGTISCLLTLFVFVVQPPIPQVATDFCHTVGSVATPLSLMIIGVSIGSQKNVLSYLTDVKQYYITFFQLLLLPILGGFILKRFGIESVAGQVSTILLGMPTGSMVLMKAKEQKIGEEIATKSVVLTTLACLFSLPFVVWLYAYL